MSNEANRILDELGAILVLNLSNEEVAALVEAKIKELGVLKFPGSQAMRVFMDKLRGLKEVARCNQHCALIHKVLDNPKKAFAQKLKNTGRRVSRRSPSRQSDDRAPRRTQAVWPPVCGVQTFRRWR